MSDGAHKVSYLPTKYKHTHIVYNLILFLIQLSDGTTNFYRPIGCHIVPNKYLKQENKKNLWRRYSHNPSFFLIPKILVISTHGDFQSGPLDFNYLFEQKKKGGGVEIVEISPFQN